MRIITYKILSIILLLVSLFSAVYLVKHNQDLRKQASIPCVQCNDDFPGICSLGDRGPAINSMQGHWCGGNECTWFDACAPHVRPGQPCSGYYTDVNAQIQRLSTGEADHGMFVGCNADNQSQNCFCLNFSSDTVTCYADRNNDSCAARLIPTRIPTIVPTSTPIPVPTNTPIPISTLTPIPSKIHTFIPTFTPTSTPRPTSTSTPRPTNTPRSTPRPTNTLISTPQPSNTPIPTSNPTSTPSGTLTPTQTPNPISTPTPTSISSTTSPLAPSSTPSNTPTNTQTSIPTEINQITPTLPATAFDFPVKSLTILSLIFTLCGILVLL